MRNSSKIQLKSIFISRIDSDDLFHKEAINEIQKQPFKKRRILTYRKGYILTYRHLSLFQRTRRKIGYLINKIIPINRVGKR